MPEQPRKKGIICRSPVDFERIFLPRAFEKKERERILKEPEKFGKSLEEDLLGPLKKRRKAGGKGKK